MAVCLPDVFLKEDLLKLLYNKSIVLLGDSNVRAIYKDLIVLSQSNILISKSGLKHKMEDSFMGDKLIYCYKLTAERTYKEERFYQLDDMEIRFYFITRVFDEYMETIIKKLRRKRIDIIMINSCLWDITRWGPKGVERYKENLENIATMFRTYLPESTLIIWLTTLPIAQNMTGGFLVPELEFLKYSLRYHVMEANKYAQEVFFKHDMDVLDLHYHLQMHINLRQPDGIHWLPIAMRHITNLILTHISLALGKPLPCRFSYEKEDTNETNIENSDHQGKKTNFDLVTKYKIDRRKFRDHNLNISSVTKQEDADGINEK